MWKSRPNTQVCGGGEGGAGGGILAAHDRGWAA